MLLHNVHLSTHGAHMFTWQYDGLSLLEPQGLEQRHEAEMQGMSARAKRPKPLSHQQRKCHEVHRLHLSLNVIKG